METKFDTEHETGLSSLVGGIIQDFRHLLIQQLTLFKVELKSDIRRAISACIPLMVGTFLTFVALFMLLHAAAYFLCWMWPELPYWGGYLLVGGSIALVGVGLVIWGVVQFKNFPPVPNKSIEGLKENFQWKTKT